MNRKSVFVSIAVILVLVAAYIIWHYSPLRYLTRSDSETGQTLTAAVKNRSRPVFVTKKILPESKNSQRTENLPRPLVVPTPIRVPHAPPSPYRPPY